MALDLDNILDIADKAEKEHQQKQSQPAASAPQGRQPRRVVKPDPATLQGQVDALDNMVYGKTVNTPKAGEYNVNEEIERIERIRRGEGVNVRNSGMPPDILDSIIRNPLVMDPTIVKESNAVAQYVEQMGAGSQDSDGGNIYDKMRSLVERTDAIDKRETASQRDIGAVEEMLENFDKRSGKTPAAAQPSFAAPASPVIDYALIKSIVNECVEEKLNRLNESRSTQNGPQLNFMSIGEKFRMVDGDDNVYECELKFLGKRKK